MANGYLLTMTTAFRHSMRTSPALPYQKDSRYRLDRSSVTLAQLVTQQVRTCILVCMQAEGHKLLLFRAKVVRVRSTRCLLLTQQPTSTRFRTCRNYPHQEFS